MEAEGAPGAVLETERMVLRELVPEDIDDLMLIFSDPEAMRYSTPRPSPGRRQRDGYVGSPEATSRTASGCGRACSRRRASSAASAGSCRRRWRAGGRWRSATYS